MKVEMYEIRASKSFLGENSPDFELENFKVRAEGHEQHSPNSTRLLNVSISGLKKIREMRKNGFMVQVLIAGRNIGVENE